MSTAKESTEQTNSDQGDGTVSRKRAVLFLVQFLLLVSIFLIGYRYSINSSANIRYLYVLSRITAGALDTFGDSSDIEPYRERYPGAQIRTELKDWGLPGVANPDPDAPLSSWEFWRHSAERAIRQEVGLTDHGPTVLFVARAADPPDTKDSAREFSFRIVPDCGAIPSMAIYLSAVLAFPALWRKKIPGALFGLIALFGINVVRLVILAYVGAYDTTVDNRIFTFIHEYVWQSIFLLFVVMVWLVWIEWLNRSQEKTT